MQTTQRAEQAPDSARLDNDDMPETKRRKMRFWINWKKLALISGLVTALSAGLVMGVPLAKEILSHVETDDAYVTAHVHSVSPKISGTIDRVLVEDNQVVVKNQPLAIIDQRDLAVAVQKAEAHLLKVQKDALASGRTIDYAQKSANAAGKSAQANAASAESAILKATELIKESQTAIAVSEQVLIQRNAELKKAEIDLVRYSDLKKEGAVTTAELDAVQRDQAVAVSAKEAAFLAIEQNKTRLNQANAELSAARAQLASAKATAIQAEASDTQVSVNEKQHDSSVASVQEAAAELADARLQYSYATIVAPVSGRVGHKNVEEGQRVQAGTPLLTIVSPEKWVVANFKETQLGDMRPGQKVTITVDALQKHEFSGTVESFSPASGSEFALLPPDNATGNFTKIVQRLPVKIVFDRQSLKQYENVIAPGLSCVVRVKVK